MHSDKMQELEHGLAAAYRSLIYAKHRHDAQGGGENQEEEEEEEEDCVREVLIWKVNLLVQSELIKLINMST